MFISAHLWRFIYLVQRDIAVYKQRFVKYGINYLLIYPAIFTLTFAYISPGVYFGSAATVSGNTLFIGNLLVLLGSITFHLMVPLLNDRQGVRFIEYQLTLFNPRALLLEMIFFAALFSGTLFVPFFPISKLLLQNVFDTSHTSWVQVFIIIYAGAFCLAAYNLLAICVMTERKQGVNFWLRCNLPLFALGGLWAPWYVMNLLSPTLGFVIRLNPFLYVSEGLRQAIISGENYFSFSTCLAMLSLYTILFTLASFWVFKKRMDHI